MTEIQLITIAALLHDIGKFMQLAKVTIPDEQLAEFERQNLKINSNSNFVHSLFSAYFVKSYLRNTDERLWQFIAFHHHPEKAPPEIQPFVKMITIADSLVNGEYRGREVEIDGKFLSQPLVSIFSKIAINDKQGEKGYISPSILQLNLQNLYPVKKMETAIPVNKTPFKELWDSFTKEVAKIDFSGEFDTFFHQLLFLLEKYTITIPAFTEKGETHIPLFHHSKIVTAITNCLNYLNSSEIEKIYSALVSNELNTPAMETPFCVLLGGDTSGIQDFIYSVTSEHALKGLRGRSFYLQLLSDAIAKSVLASFNNLTHANIFFIGGGHFFLILPIVDELQKKLEIIKERVNQNIFNAHRGKLAIAISDIHLSAIEFVKNQFAEAYTNLKQKLAIEKRKKFVTLLNSETKLKEMLGPYDVGGEQPVCEICSDELSDQEREETKRTGTRQCHFCQSYMELANDLAKNKAFSERKLAGGFKELKENPDNYLQVIQQLGFDYSFITHENADKIYIINSTDFLNSEKPNTGFQFFPQYAPLNRRNSVKTLEELADDADGLSTWGVFRADVDQLGDIFRNGLGLKPSVTEISVLSYFVSLFFSAHVEKMAREDYAGKIYIIYSGGDDMFALGPWSVLPDFGKTLYTEFRNYPGHNAAITISGGIFFAPSDKFPVYQAADSAGENLEDAKNNGRDRISMLGKSVTWKDFEDVSYLKNQIFNLVGISKPEDKSTIIAHEEKIPASLLQILYSAWADYEKAEKEKDVQEKQPKKKGLSLFRVWRLLYAFKRLKERHHEFSQELTKLENDIIKDFKLKPYLDIAIRWAEFLTRKKGEKTNA